MNRHIAIFLLLISLHILVASANAIMVLDIKQGDPVYYGDVVDLRGITGWTDNISWWDTYHHNPAVDPPDHIIVLDTNPTHTTSNISAFKITATLERGMWYQWYGFNERSPSKVFDVTLGVRPIGPAPLPVPTPTEILAQAIVNPQPQPIADVLVARWDNTTTFLGEPCQVWLLGPSLEVIGNRSGEDLVLDNIHLRAGKYSLIIQYPDGNNLYEIFTDTGTTSIINSTWKDVPSFWYAPMVASVLKDKLMSMFHDTAHFHGRIVEKKVIVEDQRIDVTTLDETDTGSIILAGITNLAKGDIVKAVFDKDRNFVMEDLAKMTFYGNVTGDDVGAYRKWQVILRVNLQTQPTGNHYITLYSPDGTEATIPFYLAEAWTPALAPQGHFKYVNLSPFIPIPTPIVITEQVTQYVDRAVTTTVYINITPDYDKLNSMQWENLKGATLLYLAVIGAFAGFGYLGFTGYRIMRGRQKVREDDDAKDPFRDFG